MIRISADEEQAAPKYFFTGIPCRRGHITVRYTNSHQCVQCSSSRGCERGRSAKGKEYQRLYQKRDYVRAKAKERHKTHRQKRPAYHHERMLRWKFGLPVGQYAALLKSQGGRCAICREEPNGKRLAVDHCHASGRIRGLLCDCCNRALGQFKESAYVLKNAVKYLRKYAKEGAEDGQK